jgi:hypothetical protein
VFLKSRKIGIKGRYRGAKKSAIIRYQFFLPIFGVFKWRRYHKNIKAPTAAGAPTPDFRSIEMDEYKAMDHHDQVSGESKSTCRKIF